MPSRHKGTCPCGLSNNYTLCCGHFIEADNLPEHPEQLMRSRYTAYALNNHEYILKTWHEHTRPQHLQLERRINWICLEIIKHQNDEVNDNEGWVEFMAHYKYNGWLQTLHERSRFLREDGHWLYVDGYIFPPSPSE